MGKEMGLVSSIGEKEMELKDGVKLNDPEKIKYTKTLRNIVGTILQNEGMLYNEGRKSNTWGYHIVDVSEDRCLGILIAPNNTRKFKKDLETHGVMIVNETKLRWVSNHHPINDLSDVYIFSLRIPEEQDIEKVIRDL